MPMKSRTRRWVMPMGGIGLLLGLLLWSGCTLAGFALGEGLDQKTRDIEPVSQDSLRAHLQQGAHVQLVLTSEEVLNGSVIQLKEDVVVLEQREVYPWPNGGRVNRQIPLATIENVALVDVPVTWKIVGTLSGALIDTGLLLFFMTFSSFSGIS